MPPFLTIFSIPKAFIGTIATQQRNAIGSWLCLGDGVDVLLCGDDPGVAEAARDLGVRHLPAIQRNERGTPLVNSAFQSARFSSTAEYLCYVNADIIFTADFARAIKQVRLKRFLMSGRRWDLDFDAPIDFASPSWETDLVGLARNKGRLHSAEAMDFFAFPRRFLGDLPPFAVGRAMWDNWLIFHARVLGGEVIDATEDVVIVHQNHGYSHTEGGQVGAYFGPEATENRRLGHELLYPFTLEDATLALEHGRLVRPRGFRGRIRSVEGAIALAVRGRPAVRRMIRKALRAKELQR